MPYIAKTWGLFNAVLSFENGSQQHADFGGRREGREGAVNGSDAPRGARTKGAPRAEAEGPGGPPAATRRQSGPMAAAGRGFGARCSHLSEAGGGVAASRGGGCRRWGSKQASPRPAAGHVRLLLTFSSPGTLWQSASRAREPPPHRSGPPLAPRVVAA